MKTITRETYREIKQMDRIRLGEYVEDVYKRGYAAGVKAAVEDAQKEIDDARQQGFAAGVSAGRTEAQARRLEETANETGDQSGQK